MMKAEAERESLPAMNERELTCLAKVEIGGDGGGEDKTG